MVNEFINEAVCAATGGDDRALAAWFAQCLTDNAAAGAGDALAFRRAALHWSKADEPQRDALAAKLGLSQPIPSAEDWPVPAAVAADYEAGWEWAMQALAI